MIFANKAGTVDASWTHAAGLSIKSGDMMLFDGTNWHVVPNETDLNAYLALAGGTMADGAGITFDTTTASGGTAGAASVTVIDGKGGSINNCVIDAGTY
jgi:hypothetical protein